MEWIDTVTDKLSFYENPSRANDLKHVFIQAMSEVIASPYIIRRYVVLFFLKLNVDKYTYTPTERQLLAKCLVIELFDRLNLWTMVGSVLSEIRDYKIMSYTPATRTDNNLDLYDPLIGITPVFFTRSKIQVLSNLTPSDQGFADKLAMYVAEMRIVNPDDKYERIPLTGVLTPDEKLLWINKRLVLPVDPKTLKMSGDRSYERAIVIDHGWEELIRQVAIAGLFNKYDQLDLAPALPPQMRYIINVYGTSGPTMDNIDIRVEQLQSPGHGGNIADRVLIEIPVVVGDHIVWMKTFGTLTKTPIAKHTGLTGFLSIFSQELAIGSVENPYVGILDIYENVTNNIALPTLTTPQAQILLGLIIQERPNYHLDYTIQFPGLAILDESIYADTWLIDICRKMQWTQAHKEELVNIVLDKDNKPFYNMFMDIFVEWDMASTINTHRALKNTLRNLS